MPDRRRNVFVTVGTTEFDELIRAVTHKDCLQTLAQLGYTHVCLQIGRGQFEPTLINSKSAPIQVDFYRYKDSLDADFSSADLIISHAGSGTCLEVLAKRKPLIVVVNQTLQDNHQIELAERLARDNHLAYCTPETLVNEISNFDPESLAPFSDGQPQLFAQWLDAYCGI